MSVDRCWLGDVDNNRGGVVYLEDFWRGAMSRLATLDDVCTKIKSGHIRSSADKLIVEIYVDIISAA